MRQMIAFAASTTILSALIVAALAGDAGARAGVLASLVGESGPRGGSVVPPAAIGTFAGVIYQAQPGIAYNVSITIAPNGSGFACKSKMEHCWCVPP